ncbi:MAG: single-stranded DNA-binding protein [Deltaproteobacteria bacterium]|nr:single-stranded DNA-binding protein [Deltaproteobacteria bacterium]
MNPAVRAARALCRDLEPLVFGAPTTHVYNPLVYAWAPHVQYLERFCTESPRDVVLLGMNPGPWGMAQTGVPFGEVGLVRDWLGISGPVGKPPVENPARPISGFACAKSEVSGARLWGWAQAQFGTPERFFKTFFVANYCPLVFMEASGKNRTPDKLPAAEREPLLDVCDAALRALIKHLRPRLVVGVGVFAEQRARTALAGLDVEIGRVLHPSPASPSANQGWAAKTQEALAALGVSFLAGA